MFTIENTTSFKFCSNFKLETRLNLFHTLLVYPDIVVSTDGHIAIIKSIKTGMDKCSVAITDKTMEISKKDTKTIVVNGNEIGITETKFNDNAFMDHHKKTSFVITNPKKLKQLIKKYFNHKMVEINGEPYTHMEFITFNFHENAIYGMGFNKNHVHTQVKISDISHIVEKVDPDFSNEIRYQSKLLNEVLKQKGTIKVTAMHSLSPTHWYGSDETLHYVLMPMKI